MLPVILLLLGLLLNPATRPTPVEPMGHGGNMSVAMEQADRLRLAGEFETATGHYLWLWEHMLEHQPAMYGVRLSFMAGEIEELVAAHEPARRAFTLKRDALGERLEDDPTPRDQEILVDWVALNQILRDDETLLAWFDEVKANPAARDHLMRLERDLREPLIKRARYADVTALHPDPLAAARSSARQHRDIRERLSAVQAQRMERFYLEDVAVIFAGLLAAGRDGEAEALMDAAAVPTDLPDARPTMIEKAIAFGVARASHRAALADAESRGGNVDAIRGRLDAALAE